jgi:hypothetical protein
VNGRFINAKRKRKVNRQEEELGIKKKGLRFGHVRSDIMRKGRRK